jgi:hypothetical protein
MRSCFYLSDARAGDAASQTVVRSIPVRTESARMAFLSAVRHRKALRRCQTASLRQGLHERQKRPNRHLIRSFFYSLILASGAAADYTVARSRLTKTEEASKAFISAKRHHTASGTLQNGSFSKGWVNWWKCWIARQSKEPCFACAEGSRRQTSVDPAALRLIVPADPA